MAANKKNGAKQTGTAKAEQRAQGIADELGYELVETALAKEPSGRFLRFTIDTDKPGGVSLDDCEKFHRRIAPLMDDIDYDYMEVTSPGVDRPLKTERDFRRALGKQVEARLYQQKDGAKQFAGRLAAADGEGFTLETASGEIKLTYAETAQTRLTLDESELDSPAFEVLENEQALEDAQAHAEADAPDSKET